MKAFKKPAKWLFLIYFLMNSLVFFGQDLSVRKNADSSWCITMAEHSQAIWNRPGNSMDSLGHSSHSFGHRHQGHEVHICVDHHKFLHSLKTPGLRAADNISYFPLVPFAKSDFSTDCPRLSLTFQGHDPGLVPYEAAISSILLI